MALGRSASPQRQGTGIGSKGFTTPVMNGASPNAIMRLGLRTSESLVAR